MKVKQSFFAVLVSLFFFVAPALADHPSHPPSAEASEPMSAIAWQEAYQRLKDRMDDLRVAKRAARTKLEKEQIRQEMYDVKAEAKQLKEQASGGIYIGSGALVVIILLLILL